MPKPTTAAAYLKSLPADRRAAIEAIRAVILDNLPDGYVESLNYGMLAYEVPLTRKPDTYNGQPLMLAALASQKSHLAVYLHALYGNPSLTRWFEGAYAKSGKTLDMGKTCVRFKTLDDAALDVIGQAIGKVSVAQLIKAHDAVHPPTSRTRR